MHTALASHAVLDAVYGWSHDHLFTADTGFEYMTDVIQKTDIHLNLVKSAILNRRTLETLAVLTVPSAPSPDAENTRTTMSTALTRLLSRFGDDGCRLLPCDSCIAPPRAMS